MSNNKAESCVETPAAPEWLSKLESRREKLTKSKLGHESGAGAPCNECGDGCPGLDLHFWRKVCRNCKCRKDQHICNEDDLSGWAQFEILGQIRSKPAYMKIKALAEQPVKLEWVPPNADADVVSDYMDKLGSELIPVAGSDAAVKRKQQLEFQVPPHDLDANLCDNLTETEASQLQQYVNKIRESCVGQGNVVRVGIVGKATIGHIGNPSVEQIEFESLQYDHPMVEVMQRLRCVPSMVVNDKVAMNILSSEKLANAILFNGPPVSFKNPFIAYEHPINSALKSLDGLPMMPSTKNLLQRLHLNEDVLKSLVQNGKMYDNLFNELERKGFDFSKDAILAPAAEFRNSYLNDDDFKRDIDKSLQFLEKITPQYSTPIKGKSQGDQFNSPIPLKKPIQTRIPYLMRQETPMRKARFGSGSSFAQDIGIPLDAIIEKDEILSSIVNSEDLHNSLQQPSSLLNKKLVIQSSALVPDFGSNDSLSLPARKRLEGIGLNKACVESAVSNGPIYDNLFLNLKKRGINFAECNLLSPIEEFREELLQVSPFEREIFAYVENLPTNVSVCSSADPVSGGPYNSPSFLSNPQSPFKSNMHVSKSTDSGFDSKPPTPNYTTFPGGMVDPSQNIVTAEAGKLQKVPGLEDLNMYPSIKSTGKNISDAVQKLNEDFGGLNVYDPSFGGNLSVPVMQCKECTQNIMSGEVAVKAERAGKNVAWHPQCFVCHKCRELLADLVYFFHGGNVYCGRDLAIILNIPRCNACDELIFTKEYTAAEGGTFHIKHFCCYQCDTPLAGQQYVPDEKTNMPLCLKCYNEFYAERCQNCKSVIGPSEQGVAWKEVHWHGECFICSGKGCGKSLIGGRFCVKNNLPFCSSACVTSMLQQ